MRKESISWTRSLGPGGGFRRRAAATHGLGPKTRSLCARAGALSFNLSVPAPVIWRAFGTGVPRSLLSELDADDVLAPQLPGADVFVPYQGVSRAGDGGGDRCGQPAVGAADGAVQDRRALNRWASHRPLGSSRRWRGGNLALREQYLPGEPAGQEGDEPYRDEVPAASVHAGAFYNAGVSAAPIPMVPVMASARWMRLVPVLAIERLPASGSARSMKKLLTLNDGKQEARHHQEPRDEPYEPGHLDVSHAEGLGQTMSKRSVWTRASGTRSSASALSAASIIGAGPQMKN